MVEMLGLVYIGGSSIDGEDSKPRSVWLFFGRVTKHIGVGGGMTLQDSRPLDGQVLYCLVWV